MHFLLFSFSCVPDISNVPDILFKLRLVVTVLHLDFISVCEGVAVDDDGTAVDGCGAALPDNFSFPILGNWAWMVIAQLYSMTIQFLILTAYLYPIGYLLYV